MRLVLITLCASAFLVSACGSTSGSSSSGSQPLSSRAQSTTSPPPASTFAALANAVCRAVRAGAPGALPVKPTAVGLRRHAIIAAPAAERTIVSLSRLANQAAKQPTVGRLLHDYTQLRALYAASGSPTLKPKNVASLAHAVTLAEETTGADARANGLPACAPQTTGTQG